MIIDVINKDDEIIMSNYKKEKLHYLVDEKNYRVDCKMMQICKFYLNNYRLNIDSFPSIYLIKKRTFSKLVLFFL